MKADVGKARWDLMPAAPLAEVVDVLTFGAVTFTVAPGLPTCAITLLWGDDLPPAFPAHPHPPGDPRT